MIDRTLVFFRLTHVVIPRVLGPKEFVDICRARDKDGCITHKVTTDPNPPYGALGWRYSGETEWRDMATYQLPGKDRSEGGLPGGSAQKTKYGR